MSKNAASKAMEDTFPNIGVICVQTAVNEH